jgi:hypothetical protein
MQAGDLQLSEKEIAEIDSFASSVAAAKAAS